MSKVDMKPAERIGIGLLSSCVIVGGLFWLSGAIVNFKKGDFIFVVWAAAGAISCAFGVWGLIRVFRN